MSPMAISPEDVPETRADTITTRVDLTDHELALLHQQCSPQTQQKVNAALSRIEFRNRFDLPHGLAGLVADVVNTARAEGKVVHAQSRLRSCRYCGTAPGYVVFKSGPRRGRPNYDKPLYLYGIEMADRFVRVQGHVTLGACNGCMALAREPIKAALADERAQVPDALAAEGRPPWRRYGKRKCTACGWIGTERQMRPLPVLMGPGTYPGGCPACDAKNLVLGRRVIEVEDGFEVLLAACEQRIGVDVVCRRDLGHAGDHEPFHEVDGSRVTTTTPATESES